ncbi:MAG TPA: GTPase HflX [Myxococcota bacterium]|nr:GTPase HflX [Myxococcota bacterium]
MSKTRAVLVSVWLPHVMEVDHDASVAEMGRLAHTLGFDVVRTLVQKRPALAAAAVLGEGKLKELAALTGGTGEIPSGATRKVTKAALREQDAAEDEDDGGPEAMPPAAQGEPLAEVVIVDNEISPSQIRNLERATGVEVLDRSGVIIEIFHRHARTREARLQVELARLAYEAPRLREKPSRGNRQRAGSVGGSGESDLELDRRRIRDRMAALKRELDAISVEQGTRRARRSDENRVTLVGYTNAGKSSLMRALTGSEVLVADQLFATLGTTVRALAGDAKPRVLVSDTVGFIKNLPHDLVASFRSTLDEAHEASLLLFVVDASDPAFRSQLQVTREVLRDIGVTDVPQRLILNKCDRVDAETRKALAVEFPGAIALCALNRQDVANLRSTLREFFERDWQEARVLLPYHAQRLMGEIREHTRVIAEVHEEEGTHLTLRGPTLYLDKLRRAIADAIRASP